MDYKISDQNRITVLLNREQMVLLTTVADQMKAKIQASGYGAVRFGLSSAIKAILLPELRRRIEADSGPAGTKDSPRGTK